ncbi:MAG: hypothetical protein AAGB46_02600, partial [Verrucomicrobiota bacterium]
MHKPALLLGTLLFAAIKTLAASPTVEEAKAALDLDPNSPAHPNGTRWIEVDSDARVGSNSLALTRTEEGPADEISFYINVQLENSATLQFYVKERLIAGSTSIAASVDSKILDVSRGPEDQDGWKHVSITANLQLPKTVEIRLAISPFEDENAALLLDSFSIAFGHQLKIEPSPGGSIRLNPANATYLTGESLRIESTTHPGHRLDRIVARSARDDDPLDPILQISKESSFEILAYPQTTIFAIYDKAFPIEGAVAWSLDPYSRAVHSQEEDKRYVSVLEIDQLNTPGILSFEISNGHQGSLHLSPFFGTAKERFSIPLDATGEEFQKVDIPFPVAPQNVQLQFGEPYYFPPLFRIQNIKYTSQAKPIASQFGLGETVASAAENDQTRLEAIPEAGWIFLGWKAPPQAALFSQENPLIVPNQAAQVYTAVFGERFETENLKLAAAHNGNSEVSIDAQTDASLTLSFSDPTLATNRESSRIEIYAMDAAPGRIEWGWLNTPFITEQTKLGFPSPHHIETLDAKQYLNSHEFAWQAFEDLSPVLHLTAPADTVLLDEAPYQINQKVSLEIQEDSQASFHSWRGDLISESTAIEIAMERDRHLAAYFKTELPFDFHLPMYWVSPYKAETSANQAQAKLNDQYPSLLNGSVEGPCLLRFEITGPTHKSVRARFQTPTSQATENLSFSSAYPSETLTIPLEKAGAFQVEFVGVNPETEIQVKFLGAYQNITYPIDSRQFNIQIEGIPYNYPAAVGETIDVQLVVLEGFQITGWQTQALQPGSNKIEVELYKNIDFTPISTLDS